MITKHFVKILITFTIMIALGLIGVSVAGNYENSSDDTSANNIGLAE